MDRQAGARWSPERMKHMEATYKKPDAQLFITTKTIMRTQMPPLDKQSTLSSALRTPTALLMFQ